MESRSNDNSVCGLSSAEENCHSLAARKFRRPHGIASSATLAQVKIRAKAKSSSLFGFAGMVHSNTTAKYQLMSYLK